MEEIDRLVDRWPDDDEVGAATFRSEVEATLRAQQARIEELEAENGDMQARIKNLKNDCVSKAAYRALEAQWVEIFKKHNNTYYLFYKN